LATSDIQAGERRKRWKTVHTLHSFFLAADADRSTMVLAVGGGTLTDTTGFAAATFMRGIPWIAVATTVVGMVDASIGGKTGIDLPQGKNLIGSFWQPKAVIADLGALATLDLRDRSAGMAEVIKAGVVGDGELVRAAACHDVRSEPQAWGELIARAAAVKARVVAKDLHDRAGRAALNLGHTFAHAFEHATHYRIAHGAAVAVGMRAAGIMARERTGWSKADHQRVLQALRNCKLGVRSPKLAQDSVIAAMRTDKKRRNGVLRFVLPVHLGQVQSGVEVPEAAVREALAIVANAPGRNW
jgi:3-dehydroquinate synthase